LQDALIELVGERGYAATTIQDIVDRANVGRTTLYIHYGSKEELFLSCHARIVGQLQLGCSPAELLEPEAPTGIAVAFRHLDAMRPQLAPIFQGVADPALPRRIRDWCAREIESNLRTAFADLAHVHGLPLLAQALAGAQLALAQWWLRQRQPHAPEQAAATFHRMRRAAICDALGSDTRGQAPGAPMD
jgi:AcrR family transcriptional regulator